MPTLEVGPTSILEMTFFVNSIKLIQDTSSIEPEESKTKITSCGLKEKIKFQMNDRERERERKREREKEKERKRERKRKRVRIVLSTQSSVGTNRWWKKNRTGRWYWRNCSK
jgi:hypothetical protein